MRMASVGDTESDTMESNPIRGTQGQAAARTHDDSPGETVLSVLRPAEQAAGRLVVSAPPIVSDGA